MKRFDDYFSAMKAAQQTSNAWPGERAAVLRVGNPAKEANPWGVILERCIPADTKWGDVLEFYKAGELDISFNSHL